MALRKGHDYSHIRVEGQSRVILGDVVYQCGDEPLSDAARQKALLSTLAYEHMNARRIQLENSKAKHLEWIWAGYNVESTESQEAPGFIKWLTSGDSLFWISGKPASGKSTLMQFLSSHQLTTKILKNATQHDWLVTHFHFDYRAHKLLPNSLEGMMRSLLSQLVAESVPMSQSIMNSRFGHCISGKFMEVGYATLQSILSSSIVETQSHVCIFLDGLDEFEGNWRGLIACVRELAEVDGVKICVASRPEPILQHAFRDLATIRMQDSNKQTISGYTTECLTEYADYLQELKSLVEKVVEQSEGVILWTYYACSELIDGMLAQETIEELKDRLMSYPGDLDEIYQRLLAKIDPRFYSEAFTMLYLIERGYSLNLREFTAVLGWLRKEGHLVSYPQQILDRNVLQARIHSRLGGMVEMNEKGTHPRVIHKTLSTFLQKSNLYEKHLPEIFGMNRDVPLHWTGLSFHIVFNNDLFDTQPLQESLANVEIELPMLKKLSSKGRNEIYTCLAEKKGMSAEDIRIDCSALRCAYRHMALIMLLSTHENIDDTDRSLIRKALVADVGCLFQTHAFWDPESRKWSFQEWLEIVRLAPLERALIFSVESHLIQLMFDDIIGRIDQPSFVLVEKCLLVMHFQYHDDTENREVFESGYFRSAEERLLGLLPSKKAQEWCAARDKLILEQNATKDEGDAVDPWSTEITSQGPEVEFEAVGWKSSTWADFDMYRCQCPVVRKYVRSREKRSLDEDFSKLDLSQGLVEVTID